MQQPQTENALARLNMKPDEERTLYAYDDLFSTDGGELVLADLATLFDVEHQREPEPIDPTGLALRQGQRRAYYAIIHRIRAARQRRAYQAISFTQPPAQATSIAGSNAIIPTNPLNV